MQRAPRFVAGGLGVSLAIVILLAGPLLLFNPAFTSALQARHGVAEAFGTGQADVDRVTTEILVDLLTDGEFGAAFAGGAPLLDARERSHMHDVARLVRILWLVMLLAAAAAIGCAWALRREPHRRGRVMIAASGAVGATAIMLAIVFAVAFEPAFLAFHAIFFPPDSYLFAPGSNLITLFPEGFWFDATLVAGASIVLAALIVVLLGVWQLRRAEPTTAES